MPFPALIRPVQGKDPIFDDVETPEDESLTAEMGRGALDVTVEVEGTPVSLLNAHFKSKLITNPPRGAWCRAAASSPRTRGSGTATPPMPSTAALARPSRSASGPINIVCG